MTPEDRAWEVVRRAYEERIRTPRRTTPSNRLLLAGVAAAVLAGAVLSPPGRAVLGDLRESVGVEHAAPALFSLPAPGRLLVVSGEGGGVWVVNGDGSKRRLGDYEDARWSPYGRYVVASGRNALVALEPDGTERWSLARPGVSHPHWGGSRTDTRVAYCTATGLRVVAGDGTGDRLVSRRACESEWRPGPDHVLAYVVGDTVVVADVDTRRVVWRSAGGGDLAWSRFGERLAVATPSAVRILDGAGRRMRTLRFRKTVEQIAFAPGSKGLAVHLRAENGARTASEIRLVAGDGSGSRRLFAATGAFRDLVWSPNGQWLLVDWPSASQWLFVPLAGRVRAVTNLGRQFPRPDDAYPSFLLAGRWCCAP